MITPRYLAGFSGHRTLANPDVIAASLSLVFRDLQERIESCGARLELYSSPASGADTVACEEAARLGIPVHIILPKPVYIDPETGISDRNRGFAADFWSDGVFLESDWTRSEQIIQTAASGANGGTLRIVAGSQIAPECYYDAGLQVLEAIDVLIAVWDGQPARGLGGTQQYVTLAERRKIPRVLVDPADGSLREFDLAALTDPDRADNALIGELENFSRDCAESDPNLPESSEQYFHRLETCSEIHSRDFRDSVVFAMLLHGAATFVAAVAAVLPQTDLPWKIVLATLAAFELFLVVRAYLRTRRLHHEKTHERWMQSRVGAELMRAMQHSVGLLDPLHPLIARHYPQWRRFATTVGLMIFHDSARRSWTDARDHYVAHRLRHPDPFIGQIAYFTQKQSQAEPRFRRTQWWGMRLAGAAILFVVGSLLYKSYIIFAKLLPESLHLYYPSPVDDPRADLASWIAAICFIFLPIALPLAAGLLLSLRTALDSGRRTYRYRELAERLTAAADTIETLDTEASVHRAVATTEEILLDELVEWHLAEQQNEAH